MSSPPRGSFTGDSPRPLLLVHSRGRVLGMTGFLLHRPYWGSPLPMIAFIGFAGRCWPTLPLL